MFEPSTADGAKGRCGMYEHRPGVCRLFGFSARISNRGSQEWMACAHMREETAPAMEAALSSTVPGGVPIMADELLSLRSSHGNPDEQMPLPINEAIERALGKQLTKAMYSAYATDNNTGEVASAAAGTPLLPLVDITPHTPAPPAIDAMSSVSSFGRPMSAAEKGEKALLEGPWRSTYYELYEWLTPLAKLTSGSVQDELVSRSEVEQLDGMLCLGTARSVVEGAWPRDTFFEGASLGFSFGSAPAAFQDPMGMAASASLDRMGMRADHGGGGGELTASSIAPRAPCAHDLELREITYEDAGVGHVVWDAAVVISIFLRSPVGAAVLTESTASSVANSIADSTVSDIDPPGPAGQRVLGRLPRVLELGAGLGLPGRDLAARGAASVTLSDSRPKLLAELARDESVGVVRLDWHSDEDVAAAAAVGCVGSALVQIRRHSNIILRAYLGMPPGGTHVTPDYA